jgi:hypothetical protein
MEVNSRGPLLGGICTVANPLFLNLIKAGSAHIDLFQAVREPPPRRRDDIFQSFPSQDNLRLNASLGSKLLDQLVSLRCNRIPEMRKVLLPIWKQHLFFFSLSLHQINGR